MSPPARGWALAVSSLATALLLLDVTVVYVALPEIQRDLGASFTELQWVVDAYALALAAVLLTCGTLADRIGRRRVFAAGLVVFAVASALCAAAPDATALDLARAVQGLGAAAMFATSLSLISARYPPGDRGFAFAVWGAVSGAALAVGPVVGGAVLELADWRWAFWLNLPLCAGLLAATLARVGESRAAAPRRPDLTGAVLFTVGAGLLVAGLLRGEPDGWGSPAIVASLAGAAAALGLFTVVELRRDEPMLDLRLLRRGDFAGTALVAFSQSFALYPMFLFLAIYLQAVERFDALATGVRMLPVTLVLFAVAPLSGRLTARLPLRVPLTAGLVVIGTGLLLMRAVDADSGWQALLPGLLTGGAGIGIISPALAAAMVGVLSEDLAALATSVNNTFRQLGIAIGIAVLGAIFSARGGDALAAAPVVAGLDAVFLAGAGVALLSAPVAWRALGDLRA
ncbi:MAG TPA: MFS transporter [Baekduia sp.]|nr:MFS transporter [Baekduia sp.]